MKFLKGFLKLMIAILMITAVLFPVLVIVHEGTHYLMYTLEGIEVTSIHILDDESFKQGNCGYITPVEDSKYGDIFQEGIAYFVGALFLVSILLVCFVKPLKLFTTRQLDLMGVKRKSNETTMA